VATTPLQAALSLLKSLKMQPALFGNFGDSVFFPLVVLIFGDSVFFPLCNLAGDELLPGETASDEPIDALIALEGHASPTDDKILLATTEDLKRNTNASQFDPISFATPQQ
jgi:hypothetical protein